MGAFNADQETQLAAYGGGAGLGYGGSGMWAMLLLVVVVLWTLFKDGHRDGGHDGGHGYGYGNGCGPCVQPAFKDESNWEEESHLKDKLCCMDKEILKTDNDVWRSACETQQVEHCEAEKTRALIEQNYIQDLRDKINEQNAQMQTLKNEAFTEKKIDQVLGAINCTNQRIGALECEIPKRPPVFAESVTPDMHHIDNDHRCGYGMPYGFPNRGRADFDFGCC